MDGRTVTTFRGSYTLANVSAQQTLTTTHTRITGSNIDYTPPTGTTHVRYEFDYKRNYRDLYQLYHFGFHIDGTEATIFSTPLMLMRLVIIEILREKGILR